MRCALNKDRHSRYALRVVEPLIRAFKTLLRSRMPRRAKVNALLRLQFIGGYRGGVRSVCLISGRSRGVSRRFRVSRIALRDMANSGRLPGLRKL